MVQNDKKLCLSCSISQERYIIWLSLMVQMCKMIISPGVFFNVKILIFKVVKGLKGQKVPKMMKISVCCTLCLRNHLSYLHIFIYGTHVCIRGGIKGQKMAQNGKKFCLSHSVSQELYMIRLWFLVHICKMMISPAKFFIFQNFDFGSF